MSAFSRFRAWLPLALVILPILAGCESDFPGAGREPTISEDAFVQTMAELRVAALTEENGILSPESRDQILSRQGLQEADLLQFIEVRGLDVPGMHAVWLRVDEAVSQGRAELDSESSFPLDTADPS